MYEEFCNKVFNLVNEDVIPDVILWEAYTKQDFLSDVFIVFVNRKMVLPYNRLIQSRK